MGAVRLINSSQEINETYSAELGIQHSDFRQSDCGRIGIVRGMKHAQRGTLMFSSYVGLGQASTVYKKKISGKSSTPKKYLKYLQPPKISRFCIYLP